MARLGPAWDALAESIDGSVVLPDAPAYDSVRRPAIVNFHDRRPAAVVRCHTAADVAETLRFAARSGLSLAIRGGGHSFAGWSSTDGILLDTTPMSTVSTDGELATVGSGCRLGALYEALAESAVTIPAGCGPDVGIAGLTLGGGLGLLGRAHGLTSDRLVSADVVLADGRHVTCDDQAHAELFWALRGAGGARFGVVTSLTFRTVAAPRLTAFRLSWPHPVAARVVEAWQEWAPDGPDGLAASLHLRTAGPTTASPEVEVVGTVLGGEAEAAAQLGLIVDRVRADPATATQHTGGYLEAKGLLADWSVDAAGETFSRSEFFDRSLPPAVIADLLARIVDGREATETRILDFMPWGGAYNRPRPDATAFVHRRARFLIKHEVVTPPSGRDVARAWVRGSWSAAHAVGTGRVYPNFPDPDLDAWSPAYHGTNLDRLFAVRAAYDPDGTFDL